MKNILTISVIAALSFSACATNERKEERKNTTEEVEGPAERTGKKIDQNIEALQQKAKELHQKSLELKEKMKDQWNKQNAPSTVK